MDLGSLVVGLSAGAWLSWRFGRSQDNRPQGDSSAAEQALSTTLPSPEPAASELTPAQPQTQPQTQPQISQQQIVHWMTTEMAQFKAGFLGRSAHELRSPINSVISLHQLILADLCESPEEEREFIAQAQTAAEKMLKVLDRLILISKVSYGVEPAQFQPVPLMEAIAEVDQLTRLQAQNRNLRLTIELPDPEIYVMSDPRWLRQALLNLLDTPISLMQEGIIRLTTQISAETQEALILIEDQRPAQFWSEPIEEAMPLVSEIPSGELNLLIVQAILEIMGGRLTILATPNETSDLTQIEIALAIAQQPQSERFL
jgi:signal transduction histidine kinase